MNAWAKGGAITGAVAAIVVGAFIGLRAMQKPPAPRAGAQVPVQQMPGADQGAGAARSGPRFTFTSRWRVTYHDAALGDVQGMAFVNWEKSRARVVLRDPATAGELTASADDVNYDDRLARITMSLRGRSPEAPITGPRQVSGQQVAAASGQAVKVEKASPELATTVKDKALPDGDRVQLELQVQPWGVLGGEWSYRADPVTKRNARGGGRSGYFRMLDDSEIDSPHEGFLGVTTGEEIWSPLAVTIDHVQIVEDQLAATTAGLAFPYPFNDRAGATPSDDRTRRTLLLIGRNFPLDQEQLLTAIDNRDDEMRYTILAHCGQRDVDPKTQALVDAAWAKASAQLTDAEKAEGRSMLDWALVGVELQKNVLPGPHTVIWGEGSRSWFLQFGDMRADARFVRRLTQKVAADATSKDEFERTGIVFLPEEIALEVETRAVLPLDKLPVKIEAGNGATLAIDAQQIAESSHVYRTAFFTVGKPGSGAALQADPKIAVRATVRYDDVKFITPPIAEATVFLTPDQLSNATLAKSTDAASKVRLWKEALVLAAQNAPPQPADKPKLTPETVAGTNVGSYADVPIMGSDAAALLLMRSEFLSLLYAQRDYLDSLKTDDDVEGFRQWVVPYMQSAPAAVATAEPPVGWEKYPDYLKAIEFAGKMKTAFLARIASLPVDAYNALALESKNNPVLFGEKTYFGEIDVPGPGDAPTWKYYATYYEDRAYDRWYGGAPNELRQWRTRATRVVIDAYRNALDATIKNVEAIAPGDYAKLVELVPVAFVPSVQRLLPTLMQLDANGRWVRDRQARAAVGNLYVLGEAAMARKDYVALRERLVVDVGLELLTLVEPELLFGERVGKAVAWTQWTGFLAWEAGSAIYAQYEVRQEADYLFGAAGVIGADRANELLVEKTPYYAVLAKLAKDRAVKFVKGRLIDAVVSGETIPLRLRSTEDRMRSALRQVRADGMATYLRRYSWGDTKPWPLPVVQGLIERAQEVEEARITGRPLSATDMMVRHQVARMGNDLQEGHADKAPMKLLGEEPAPAQPWAATPSTTQNEPPPTAGTSPAQPATTRMPAPDLPPSTPAASAPPSLPPGAVSTQGPALRPLPATSVPAGAASTQGPALPPLQPTTRPEGPPRTFRGATTQFESEPLPGSAVPGMSGRAAPQRPASAVTAPTVAAVADRSKLPVTGTPARRSWFPVIENDKEIEYRLETDEKGNAIRLGAGASSEVYIIKDVKGREPGQLFDKTGSVIKIAKDHKDFGTAREQVLRMQKTWERIKSFADIVGPEAEMLEFHPDASEPYVVQRKIAFDGKRIVMVKTDGLYKAIRIRGVSPLKDYDEVVKTFPPEFQEALVKLYANLAHHGLVSPDLSLPNVYFTLDNGVKCAPLDIDHIADFHELETIGPHDDKTLSWLTRVVAYPDIFMPSNTVDNRPLESAEVFMEKAFELPMGGNRLNRYVEIDGKTLDMQPRLVDPQLIRKYFPDFKPKVPEAPAKRSEVPSKGFMPTMASYLRVLVAIVVGEQPVFA
jgi:hypothetical protein